MPNPLLFLSRPAPAPYFHLFFLIFQIPPSEGGNQTLLPPLLEKKNCVWEGLEWVGGFQTMRFQLWFPNYELAKKTPEQSFYC